jgi:small subunit ribosomal protein S16
LIEKLGTYNPNTNPATIELDFDSALNWLNKGAQPTDTARALLSYKGVMLKKHLDGGVKKGAFTAEVAEERLATWLKEQEQKIQAKKEALAKAKQDGSKQRLAAESKTKEAKAEVVAEKKNKAAKEAKEAADAVATKVEETTATAETPAEQPAAPAEQPATTEAPSA